MLAPIVPSATGNGLAMRADLFVRTLAAAATVDVAVVPVAGRVPGSSATSPRTALIDIPPLGADQAPRHVAAQVAVTRLRQRLEATAPLPHAAAAAPPTLADDVLDRLSGEPDVVVGLRLGLAPLAAEAAHRVGARLVIDSDDDDATLLRDLGEDEQAEAHDRLAAVWLPDADLVLTAAGQDADALGRRLGVETAVVPNVVDLPDDVGPPPGRARILYVGNLTYEPNIRAVTELATDVLPEVRRSRPDATLTAVGAHDDRLASIAALDGVDLTGPVSDVTPHYAATDAVVVPLRVGSGTRIKVLEAFAHRRPVVATPVAVAGLEVDPDCHVRLAEAADDLAAATVAVLDRGPEVEAMTAEAYRLVAENHTDQQVGRLVRRLVLDHD